MAEILTPYDTGQRAEPALWQRSRAEVLQVMRHGEAEDIGNVDFDDDEGTTVATVHVSRDPDGGHTVHVIPHTDTIRLDLHTER
ncbi:hypothetical protein ACTXLB_20655 [Brachybacterium tyrofermentans]|uniref:hypothetical protein n=1 Tax=Brachybacterium tyrofermentans TaxID=47848 RepID=UPI003FD33457